MGSGRLEVILLVGAAVLLVAIVAVRFAVRIGLPGLLAYLAIGLLLQSVVGFNDAARAQSLALAALVLILAEGGLTTRWEVVRHAMPAAVLMATVGVGISMAITGLLVHYALGGSWRLSFLLGAVVSSTDAAAVFSVLRRLRLPRRISGLLELESGLNDAPAVIAVVLLSSSHPQHNPGVIAGVVVFELAVGALLGGVIGWLGAVGLRRVALPASGLYPIAVLSLAVLAYAIAVLARSSGFIAVYAASLVLGNTNLPHRPATRGFAEGIAWLAQIGLFVLLGLLVTPSALPREFLPALATGAVLLFVARPCSVLVALLPLNLPRLRRFRINLAEATFLSWAGLRGAVPIVLATVPVTAGVPGSSRLFALVFVLVVVFTLVQGPALPRVVNALGIAEPAETTDLGVETAPLETLNADLLQLRIPPGSRLHGVEVFELRLPRGSSVTLVERAGVGFVPDPETELRTGDTLLIVATANTRADAERRLRAVSRRGKMAGWYGEYGE